MWRKSNRFSKNIVVLFFVLLLAVSPCFARASWAAFFPVKEATSTSVVDSQVSESQLQQDSSPVDSTVQSETQKMDSSQALQEQLNALEKELMFVQNIYTLLFLAVDLAYGYLII